MEIDFNQLEIVSVRDTGFVIRANLYLTAKEVSELFKEKEEIKP